MAMSDGERQIALADFSEPVQELLTAIDQMESAKVLIEKQRADIAADLYVICERVKVECGGQMMKEARKWR